MLIPVPKVCYCLFFLSLSVFLYLPFSLSLSASLCLSLLHSLLLPTSLIIYMCLFHSLSLYLSLTSHSLSFPVVLPVYLFRSPFLFVYTPPLLSLIFPFQVVL